MTCSTRTTAPPKPLALVAALVALALAPGCTCGRKPAPVAARDGAPASQPVAAPPRPATIDHLDVASAALSRDGSLLLLELREEGAPAGQGAHLAVLVREGAAPAAASAPAPASAPAATPPAAPAAAVPGPAGPHLAGQWLLAKMDASQLACVGRAYGPGDKVEGRPLTGTLGAAGTPGTAAGAGAAAAPVGKGTHQVTGIAYRGVEGAGPGAREDRGLATRDFLAVTEARGRGAAQPGAGPAIGTGWVMGLRRQACKAADAAGTWRGAALALGGFGTVRVDGSRVTLEKPTVPPWKLGGEAHLTDDCVFEARAAGGDAKAPPSLRLAARPDLGLGLVCWADPKSGAAMGAWLLWRDDHRPALAALAGTWRPHPALAAFFPETRLTIAPDGTVRGEAHVPIDRPRSAFSGRLQRAADGTMSGRLDRKESPAARR